MLRALSAAHPEPRKQVPFQRWNVTRDGCSAEFWRLDQGRFLLRFSGVADYEVDLSSRSVRCTPIEGCEDALVFTFEQQVSPLLLSLSGEQVFHGAAIARGNCAIALLGPSGRGKSTLTAALAIRGNAFLGDDLLHLEVVDQMVLARPQVDCIRLWEDSATELGKGRAIYSPGSRKPRLVASQQISHCNQALPLARVYLLGDNDVRLPSISPLSPSQQLISWTANAFVLDIKNPEVLRRNLRACGQLVRTVPMRRLDYPRRFDALPAVVDAVLADEAG